MHFQQVVVVKRDFHILLDDVLLDTVVVQFDVLEEVYLRNINEELLALLRTEEVPQLFEVSALEDPFILHKKLEDFANFFTTSHSLSHFLGVLLVLFAHQRPKSIVRLDWNHPLDLAHLDSPLILRKRAPSL